MANGTILGIWAILGFIVVLTAILPLNTICVISEIQYSDQVL